MYFLCKWSHRICLAFCLTSGRNNFWFIIYNKSIVMVVAFFAHFQLLKTLCVTTIFPSKCRGPNCIVWISDDVQAETVNRQACLLPWLPFVLNDFVLTFKVYDGANFETGTLPMPRSSAYLCPFLWRGWLTFKQSVQLQSSFLLIFQYYLKDQVASKHLHKNKEYTECYKGMPMFFKF